MVEVMVESNQDEKVELFARYAVAMHLEANRKVGRLARIVTVLAVIIAIYSSSFWPIAIALVLCVAIYFYIILSCVRYVERQIGMPEDMQAIFSRRYKTDVQFAQEVDELHKGGSILAHYLK